MQATLFHSGMRVGADDIEDATGECPVCGSRQARRPRFRIQDDPRIDMLACDACGACSASQMPKPALLDRYYAGYYAGDGKHVTFADPERFARHVVAGMDTQLYRSPLRILDYGGGDGSLATAIGRRMRARAQRDMRVEIDLVDYEQAGDPEAREIAIRRFRHIEEIEPPYDLVLASAILEHIPAVGETIRRLTAAAGTGAYLYARTPYVLPLARLLPNLDMTYPAHVHDMGGAFWGRFVETLGLPARLISSRPSLVETGFCQSPLRTVIAHALKLPAIVEMRLLGVGHAPWWRLVGGWEAMVRFD